MQHANSQRCIFLIFFANILLFCIAQSNDSDSFAHAPNGSMPMLIPRDLLIGGDDYRSVRLSPDGRTLAYLAQYNGVSNVWIRPLIPAGPPRPLTKQSARPIHVLRWAYDIEDGQTLLFSQDRAGEENDRIFAISTKGERAMRVRLLTPSHGVQARLIRCSYRKPHRAVVAMNDRDRACHDYYVIDIRTAERTLAFKNTECYSSAIFDEELKLRILSKETTAGGVDYYLYEKVHHRAANISLLRSVPPDEVDSTSPLRLDSTGDILYWTDASESDKAVLMAQRLSTGVKKVIYEPTSSDLIDITFHPMSQRPVLVYESYFKPKQVVLSPTATSMDDGDEDNEEAERRQLRHAATAWRHLRAALPARAEPFIASASHDFATWLVVGQTDNAPATYWLYRSPILTYLFSKNEHLNRYELAERRAVTLPTDDGLTQLCYVTLPAESVDPAVTMDTANAYRPSAPLPTVLFVHGGPWTRDRWGFDNIAQLLANRGYAVLQCNYRGSSGFGKRFATAGDGEWGRKMQQDLTDAVNWAVREGVAAADRVAIAGFSYGGYAALAGLTTTPNLYACAVDAVGPSNLLTLMHSLPPYWTPVYNFFKRRLGADPATEEGRRRLMDASPYFHAEHIKKPLLVAQGANDPRVKRQESDMIVKAARANNVTVTYALFPDEGHGFRKPQNSAAFWALTEQFLHVCLGGRSQKMLDALQLSSMELVEK